MQRWSVKLQEIIDFPRMHPARELKRLALEESVAYARQYMRHSIGMESGREVLAFALDKTVVPGHYLEFGVFKGGSIRFIAGSVGAAHTVHGFDSFEGLPEAWTGNTARFNVKGRLPKVPGNVVLHKGRFSESLPLWLEQHPGPAAFVHIDCDLYESAQCILEHLSERIVPGTVLVFDEYFNYPNWQEHEFRAFQDAVERYQIRYEYLAYARFQAAVRIGEIARSGGIAQLSAATEWRGSLRPGHNSEQRV